MLEAGTWECDVHQNGESLEFMQQVLYCTLPVFLMQDKEIKKSLYYYGNTYIFGQGRGISLIFKVPFHFSFCKINIFLLGVSYFHIGRAQKLTIFTEGSAASLHSFLVAPLTIANPQPLFISSGRSWGLLVLTAPSFFQQLSVTLWPQPGAPFHGMMMKIETDWVFLPVYSDHSLEQHHGKSHQP